MRPPCEPWPTWFKRRQTRGCFLSAKAPSFPRSNTRSTNSGSSGMRDSWACGRMCRACSLAPMPSCSRASARASPSPSSRQWQRSCRSCRPPWVAFRKWWSTAKRACWLRRATIVLSRQAFFVCKGIPTWPAASARPDESEPSVCFQNRGCTISIALCTRNCRVSKPIAPSFLVFSDDWGRHPSSCQHLFGQLLGRYRVHWVNTIGTRTPQFNLATVRRGFEKVKQWLGRSGRVDADASLQPEVLQPRMWPWFGRRFDRRLNRWLLTKQLRTALAALPEPPVAVTTLPIVADLMDDLPVRRWVYYCVDDFGEWPGLDGTTLRRLEQMVVHKASRIVAVSEMLQARLEK